MNSVQINAMDVKAPAWVCLRSQPKHEHIAATHLRRMVDGIEVFCPRLRIRRRTRRGATWFVEALFPGYLFARFEMERSMLHVKSVPGVKAIVRFGTRFPAIPVGIIEDLRTHFDDREIREVADDLAPGQEVTIAGGPLHGLSGAVLNVRSGTERVQVLLEMLGRFTPVEVSREQILSGTQVAKFLAA
jgi:transcriptional antiterminator RfaH